MKHRIAKRYSVEGCLNQIMIALIFCLSHLKPNTVFAQKQNKDYAWQVQAQTHIKVEEIKFIMDNNG